MPATYIVKVLSISTDGTNLFFEISIFDGEHTLPYLYPVFKVGTSAATITAYLQTIATNRPALTADIVALMGSQVTG